jgi:hypothetical protein
MTEVLSSANQGLGLYATKSFQPGDIILEESALFTFQPTTKEQISSLRSQFKSLKVNTKGKDGKDGNDGNDDNDLQSCLDDLSIPSNIDMKKHSKFLGMVTAVATYAIAMNSDMKDTSTSTKLNTLYKPPTETTTTNNGAKANKYEEEIIQLATDVISYLRQNTIESTPLHKLVHDKEEECKGIMLIWSCNAFKGGHVYEIMSRVNHSCDFNAVVSIVKPTSSSKSSEDKNNETQIMKATSIIKPGDEIHISYLGSYTYAGINQRKKILCTDKYFDCQCERCRKENKDGDVASCIPCTSCHGRISGRYLDDDVQYDDDDENEVCYALPRLSDEDGKSANERKYACQKCGMDKSFALDSSLNAAMEKTVERVVNHLNACENTDSDGDDDVEREEELAEMTERLICLSYSVLGARHYCTNLLLVQSLGRSLSAIHTSMICSSTGQKGKKKKGNKNGDDDKPAVDMTELAECIDLLERSFKYVKSLNLKSHPGHLLGNVTIGVSRVLVGLGDVKSMKFGADWAEKVQDYFACEFEGNGMAKVVETLSNAWKRKTDEIEPQKRKRIKL